MTHYTRFSLLVWMLALAVAGAGCATADTGDDDDIGPIADAAPGAPDARPGAPDARPGAPDARPGAPDAQPGAPDAAATCPRTPCDLVAQCGCTPPQVCDLSLTNLGETTCRTVDTPGMVGSACSALQDCAGGFVCVDGNCQQYCNVDADCGDPRRKCIITLQSGGTPIPNATTCSSACDPTDAAAGGLCPAGFSCTLAFDDPDMDPQSGDEIPFATCNQAGSATQGQTCSTTSDCAINHLCINTGTGSVCARVCTLSPAGGECSGTTSCGGLVPRMVIAGTEYGACL